MNPASIFRRSAQMFSGKTAVWCEGATLTYGQLFERAARLANALRACGAAPGDRVAVLADNALESVEQAVACALANNPRATLYTYHAPAINRYLLELTGARILIVQRKYYDGVASLLSDLKELKSVLVFGGEAPPSAIAYEEAIKSARPDDEVVPVSGNDVHIIRFSSGTTGKPKGIYHTVDRWIACQNEWRWMTPLIDDTSTYLVPCSLAHLGVSLLWGFLTSGGRIMPMPKFDSARTLELIETERATHVPVAPVMIRGMLDDPSCKERDVSSVKCLMYAGSPIALNTLKEAIDVFGPVLFQLYAQSEAMPISMLLPHHHTLNGSEQDMRRLRSAGRAMGNNFVTVRNEDGDVLPPEQVGEIAFLGPGSMSGLWNDPQGQAARTLPDGSVLTRDMGFLDKEGFIYLVDRKDDMIVSGAYNIWPSELEEALCKHPAVKEACVFGVPDEKWGETPKAVVVLRSGHHVPEQDLITFTRDLVGPVKKVTSVSFADELPRTSTGKVLRGDLKAPYWKGQSSRIAGS